MTSRFIDKFDRADGDIGANYTLACGGVVITDEAVIPINAAEIPSGISPQFPFPSDVTAFKTQVLYTADAMDGPDYVVRGTFAHDGESPSELDTGEITTAPSFTLLARMTKDPLLYDLNVEEDPSCYDQGYGARVTFPLDGSAPVLKLIKFMPLKRLPGLARPSSSEADGMVVLAEVTLDFDDLNLDPGFDPDTYVAGDILPYKGYWQDMRLRIQRKDSQVDLDVFLNDRNLNTPKLTYRDRVDPLWGVIGVPGFEFLSGQLTTQPAGVSPYGLAGLSQLRCGIFTVETFRSVMQPTRTVPGGAWTYRDVTNRVILLVEKDGDAKYNATTNAQSKFETYLRFVLEAEADIIRKEGYFDWMRRTQSLYLRNGVAEYELPEDLELVEVIRPGNWNDVPLTEMDTWRFHQLLGGSTTTAGRPRCYTPAQTGADGRKTISIYPAPGDTQIPANGTDDPYLIVEYFARQLYPSEPDVQIPFVPQAHIDVLTYGAAAHALVLDTDDANAMRMAGIYDSKLRDLRRANNRKVSGKQTVFRSVADQGVRSHVPLLRASQLDNLLAF
jgi:hypothetical protein